MSRVRGQHRGLSPGQRTRAGPRASLNVLPLPTAELESLTCGAPSPKFTTLGLQGSAWKYHRHLFSPSPHLWADCRAGFEVTLRQRYVPSQCCPLPAPCSEADNIGWMMRGMRTDWQRCRGSAQGFPGHTRHMVREPQSHWCLSVLGH